MIRSMTGYGKGSASTELYDIQVEIKSVNHRFLDLSFRMPSFLSGTEMKFRDVIKSGMARGSVTAFVNLTKKPAAQNIRAIDKNVAQMYTDMLNDLKQKLNLGGEVTLDILLKFNDIFAQPQKDEGDDDTVKAVLSALDEAIIDINKYRDLEGNELNNDFDIRLFELGQFVDEIEKHSKDAVRIQYDRLKERVDKFVDANSINKERLEHELVLISDKVDISEEITRLRAHIALFKKTMESDKPLGKILNNIVQELHREASTTSAKTNLTEISHISVKLKEIIENIREQVQNVE
ncbi:MAG: YicC family protein [Candidatus Delongbacteria bacterium]|nr:YicC family protein [Candidatus Delongbacteria bacterium]